jgi:cation transport protein ChaC
MRILRTDRAKLQCCTLGGVDDTRVWIFGYGSLVWRPEFPHLRAQPAFIRGYARRFWQGSTDHRGLPGRPGRVVTLLPECHESLDEDESGAGDPCWGTAYEIPSSDPEKVFAGLDHRERGGYDRVELEITLAANTHSVKSDGSGDSGRAAGVVYIASPENPNYLGAASIREIASQVANASGPSGANPEYVFELARSLREMGASDAHVFAVEAEVSRVLAEKEPGFN